MNVEEITRLEFYYDSGVEQPREDPEELRDQLSELAASEGLEYEEIDRGELPIDKRQELYQEVVTREMRKHLPYALGARTFATKGNLFGGMRPALLVYYEGETTVPDVYPHRGADSNFVTVQDFVNDDISRGEPTTRQDDEDGSNEEPDQEKQGMTPGILGQLKRSFGI